MHVYVTCHVLPDGHRCSVRVGDDAGATHHEVRVRQSDLGGFGFDAVRPEDLVRESFQFLLEREPREEILSRFELMDIARYFREYPIEIRKRLGGRA
jgi:hypothetical protein